MNFPSYIAILSLFSSPLAADDLSLLDRIVERPISSANSVFPNADLLCVIGEYNRISSVVEQFGIKVSFWSNDYVDENTTLILLYLNKSETERILLKSHHFRPEDMPIKVWPQNSCFHLDDISFHTSEKWSVPVLNSSDDANFVQIPSRKYIILDIVENR